MPPPSSLALDGSIHHAHTNKKRKRNNIRKMREPGQHPAVHSSRSRSWIFFFFFGSLSIQLSGSSTHSTKNRDYKSASGCQLVKRTKREREPESLRVFLAQRENSDVIGERGGRIVNRVLTFSRLLLFFLNRKKENKKSIPTFNRVWTQWSPFS